MGGLLILFLIGAYAWTGYKIVRCVRPAWGKTLVVVMLLLAPTADAIYGRIKLERLCESEGGLHVYRMVEGVAGFDDPKSRPDESTLRIRKYKFVEGIELDGSRSRLSVLLDGTYLREKGVTPISEYVYESTRGDDKDIYYRYEQRIRVRATGEIIGNNVDYSYAGGWFERFVSGIYAARGVGGSCNSFIPATKFIPTVLKPIGLE